MIDQSEEAELSLMNEEMVLKKQPGVKVESKDAEMIKPAEHSEPELNFDKDTEEKLMEDK